MVLVPGLNRSWNFPPSEILFSHSQFSSRFSHFSLWSADCWGSFPTRTNQAGQNSTIPGLVRPWGKNPKGKTFGGGKWEIPQVPCGQHIPVLQNPGALDPLDPLAWQPGAGEVLVGS